jgi:hypothetical protein
VKTPLYLIPLSVQFLILVALGKINTPKFKNSKCFLGLTAPRV